MNCPLCNSSDSKFYIKPYHWRKTKKQFTVVECNKCAHLYTKDAPLESDIAAYYDSETYISHTDSKKTVFDKIYNVVKQYMLAQKWKWMRPHVPRGTIVDYGAGTGSFVHFIKQLGREAYGYEIAKTGRETAKKLYNVELDEPEELDKIEENNIAAFTMWHVLEHIYNPGELINKIHKKLKKDGLLVVAVPNPNSWDAKNYKEHWAAWDVPIHISHFKPKVIIEWMEKLGFQCVQTKGMPFDAFYVSMISNENKLKRKRPITAVLNGLKSNLKGINKKNQSSVVYIFKKVEKRA